MKAIGEITLAVSVIFSVSAVVMEGLDHTIMTPVGKLAVMTPAVFVTLSLLALAIAILLLLSAILLTPLVKKWLLGDDRPVINVSSVRRTLGYPQTRSNALGMDR